MKEEKNKNNFWNICIDCKGIGKKKQRVRKNVREAYQKALALFENSNGKETAPIKPVGILQTCTNCKGTGLILSSTKPEISKEKHPHVAIIGGGIGGVALAVACLHRGIPFTLFERDTSFNERSQGYGLTLQQASKAMASLGILSLDKGVTSTKHLVHKTDGKIIGEWGIRKWGRSDEKSSPKRTNIHIARQSLRLKLLEQLGENDSVKWGHQFISFKESSDENVELQFKVNGTIKTTISNLVVGADGIRSTVRKQLIGEKISPLQYLGCIVILGICPIKNLENIESPLLDAATVFQTANGTERIYMMPYDSDTIMWQLSFPIPENEAKKLNKLGTEALKKEACKRTQWHSPIPEIVAATYEAQISGYPVYDRDLLKPAQLQNRNKITLLGDAAHPMSPFKGQGANQALLDALSLAREITKDSKWREIGIRKNILNSFEAEMIKRSASKVKSSAESAKLLHSEIVLKEGNGPRGKYRKS